MTIRIKANLHYLDLVSEIPIEKEVSKSFYEAIWKHIEYQVLNFDEFTLDKQDPGAEPPGAAGA